MKRPLIAFIVFFIALLGAVSRADDAGEKGADDRTLTATGSAYEDKAPDVVAIEMAVETTSSNAAEAVSENGVKAGRLIEAIKKLLGEGGSIKTSSYSVQPLYEYDKVERKNVPAGFRAANQIVVRTQNINAAGRIIDGAVSSGANRIDGLRFFVSDESGLCASALAKASESARAIASSAAKAMGVRLKGIKHIAPYCGTEQQRVYYQVKEALSDAASQTPVEPGSTRVSATVNVTFYIGD